MKFTPTNLDGCYVIDPNVINDERGYFMESFNEKTFQEGVNQEVNFVQDNQSFSTRGVLRGLHYQCGEHSQAKLVRVLSGEVLDVAVDIRPESSTYGEHFSIVLSEENNKQLFVPRGFAHGFLVLSESAIFFYKCDNYYNKNSEGGIIYNDQTLSIDWHLKQQNLIISEKDQQLPLFSNSLKIW
ncbi:MAG: dTDP-4-dehydrorhamnose 3,5-epimerase [Flavobacterium sp.]